MSMSTISAAKSVVNYLPANQRPACNNCAHAEERFAIYTTWWCGRADFLVTAMAVCAEYKKRPAEAA